ncbi:MAG: secondary thiamine-phosphate synthase enzyme YjbQ, partial [Nanoarchaeota archaeon]|nr:secondary thiamine-phosphate synthase enzyme YjbQ [Nanoarchaeota archaeon]
GAIVINENADPNLCDDILGVLKEIVPEHNDYKHDRIDNNAAAHIRAVLLGSGKFVPFERRELMLGKWQNIFFVELDGPREREIIITILENQKA